MKQRYDTSGNIFTDTMGVLNQDKGHHQKNRCWDFDKKEQSSSWTETFGIPFYSNNDMHEPIDTWINKRCFYFSTFTVIAICGIALVISYLSINLSKS